jgi:hypothetical protein
MTTPLFFEMDTRPRLESLLIQTAGAHAGTREVEHNDELKAAVKADSPGIWDPSQHAEVQAAAKNRGLVMWNKASFAFVPGPATHGSVVTLHYGFIPPGHANPTTAAQFRSLPGYTVRVFGGVGDPQFVERWQDFPFSTSRHRVLQSNLIKVNGNLKLAWWYDVQRIAPTGGTIGSGAHFFLRVIGLADVYGEFA